MRVFCFLIMVLLLSVNAYAGNIRMLIVDKDINGTNVRDKPSGKIITTIPFVDPAALSETIETRVVYVTGQKGDWFSVLYNSNYEGDANNEPYENQKGWMHKSVLGTCASATEDGDPYLHAEPDDSAATTVKVASGTRLTLEGVQGIWIKVRYPLPGGKGIVGWLPEQAIISNPTPSCLQ